MKITVIPLSILKILRNIQNTILNLKIQNFNNKMIINNPKITIKDKKVHSISYIFMMNSQIPYKILKSIDKVIKDLSKIFRM